MTRDFSSVGVIGLGTMGAGIVEVFARNGIHVIAVEVDAPAIEHGKAVLGGGDRAGAGPRQDDPGGARRAPPRVTFTSDLGDLAACQLVVEAVPEHLDLKKELLGKVDAVVSADAILATNTSSLPVTEIAVATSTRTRRRHALLQPGARAAVRRGDPHGHHRPMTSSRTSRRSRSGWARSRSSSATRPASSPTRCSSAT